MSTSKFKIQTQEKPKNPTSSPETYIIAKIHWKDGRINAKGTGRSTPKGPRVQPHVDIASSAMRRRTFNMQIRNLIVKGGKVMRAKFGFRGTATVGRIGLSGRLVRIS